MPLVTGFDYLKSWAGLLKIGEFFALLIAFSCLADFADKSVNNGSFKFFLFVTITAWLATMLLFALLISGIQHRISVNWSLAMVIYSALYAFLLLISTSLVAEKARQFRRGVVEVTHESQTPRTTRTTFVDTCEYYNSNSPCSNVEAAVVFAFIALALFITDTIFYFLEYRSANQSAGNEGFAQHDETGIQQDSNPEVEQIP